MAIVIVMPGRDSAVLRQALSACQDEPVFDAAQSLTEADRLRVHLAVVWYPPAGFEADFPNLQAVLSYGAGAEFLLQGEPLPSHLLLGRLIDPHLRQQMARYLLSIVLSDHGHLAAYAQQQQRACWQPLDPVGNSQIGFLGRGLLARFAGEQFARLGYRVAYWHRQANPDDPTSCEGDAGLASLLCQSDVIICLLPLTDRTRGLLDATRLAHCTPQTLLINAGRGGLVNQSDLIELLDRGLFRRVWLDVTDPEPLPPDSPLWQHERLRITPHVASKTDPYSAASVIAANNRSLRSGDGLLNPINRHTGY